MNTLTLIPALDTSLHPVWAAPSAGRTLKRHRRERELLASEVVSEGPRKCFGNAYLEALRNRGQRRGTADATSRKSRGINGPDGDSIPGDATGSVRQPAPASGP